MSTDDGMGQGLAGAAGALPEGSTQALEQEVEVLRHRLVELEGVGSPRHRVRRVTAAILAVLTVLCVVATTAAAWQSRTLLDTDRFMAIVEPALVSSEVSEALRVRLSEEVLDALSLEERLGERLTQLAETVGTVLAEALELSPEQRARVQSLPLPELADLAAPIASGLEARITTRIDQFLSTDEFDRLLVELTEQAHTRSAALLRGDLAQLPAVEIEAGEVRLNLVPVVARVLEELVDQGLSAVGVDEIPFIDPFGDPAASLDRLSTALGAELPPDFGQLTVMSEAELVALQTVARTAERLVWLFAILSIVLLALTVAVAPHRRRAVVQVALGSAAGLVIARLALRSAVDDVAALAPTPQGRVAVTRLTEAVLESLRTDMIVALVLVLIVAAVLHLAGRPRWLTSSVATARNAIAQRPGDSDLQA